MSGILSVEVWDFVPEALRMPNRFIDSTLEVEDRTVEVNIKEGVKLPATTFSSRFENASERVAADPELSPATSRQKYEPYVNEIRLCIATVQRHMSSGCCTDLDARRKLVRRADAVSKY